jgi:hypothetical protein
VSGQNLAENFIHLDPCPDRSLIKLSQIVSICWYCQWVRSLVVDALFLFSLDNNFVTTIFLIFQQESLLHRIPAYYNNKYISKHWKSWKVPLYVVVTCTNHAKFGVLGKFWGWEGEIGIIGCLDKFLEKLVGQRKSGQKSTKSVRTPRAKFGLFGI